MNKLKKVFYSIFKIEKYQEMAAEGTKAAVLHLVTLALIVTIVVSPIAIYQVNKATGEAVSTLETKVPDFEYKEGNLTIQSENKPAVIDNINQSIATIILDDTDKTDEEIEAYKTQVKEKGNGYIFLKDKLIVVVKDSEEQAEYKYTDFAEKLGINDGFNKTQLIGNISESRNSQSISLCISQFLVEFVGFFIYLAMGVIPPLDYAGLLVWALILAMIGYIIAVALKVKMKYKAIFNMSVYALTLSTILKVGYVLINAITGYTVSLFTILYFGVACIYLIAALFITRVDLMKTQEELTRIKETQKEVEKEQEEEKQKEEEEGKKDVKNNKEENKKKKETQKKEPTKKKQTKKKTPKQNKGGEPEGSSV